MLYADMDYYGADFGGTSLFPCENADRMLRDASADVDVLTFGHIRKCGIEGLSAPQRDTVREVVCELAEWKAAHADELDTPYRQYAVNGVSMTVGSTDTVCTVGGVMLPARLYRKLVQSGLCSGAL